MFDDIDVSRKFKGPEESGLKEGATRSVATHKPIICQPLAHLGHVEISTSNPTADI